MWYAAKWFVLDLAMGPWLSFFPATYKTSANISETRFVRCAFYKIVYGITLLWLMAWVCDLGELHSQAKMEIFKATVWIFKVLASVFGSLIIMTCFVKSISAE